MGWQAMKSAPLTDAIEIEAEEFDRPFLVRWEPGFVDSFGEDQGGWVAVNEGEHPDDWTDGVCWSVNENLDPSSRPLHWRPAPASAQGAV